MNNVKPWPHSPGIITTSEYYYRLRPLHRVYEARIFGHTGYFSTYEAAVAFCMTEKRFAAWYEEQLKARNSPVDELAI